MDVHFCPQCSQILTITRHGDYFSFLGVPRKLNLDLSDLEQRFRRRVLLFGHARRSHLTIRGPALEFPEDPPQRYQYHDHRNHQGRR